MAKMKRIKIQKKLMLTKKSRKTQFTALSSQLVFSLFSLKKYFEKMKIGQF
jgi:hypothetical protein